MSWHDTVKTCKNCRNTIFAFELETDYGKLALCNRCHFKARLEQLEKRTVVMQEFDDLFKSASENAFSEGELENILIFVQKNEVGLKEAFERIRGELLFFIESESDNEITEKAVDRIEELKNQLKLSPEFIQAVDEEIGYLTQILQVKKGILPTETFVNINLPSDEILHYQSSAIYTDSKHNRHEGKLYLTNNRLIFQSWDGNFEFSYNKILSSYVSDFDTLVEHR